MPLKDFCRTVGVIVASCPEEDLPRRIADVLPALLRERDLLTPAQKALPPKGYGRHDVFLCPNDRFSVVAAIWPAGIVSPIHDHLTWCTYGVFEGVVEERRYAAASDDPDCCEAVRTGTSELVAGQVAHLPVGGGDIHSMHNPGDRPAVSIHVYGGNSVKLGPNVEKVYRPAAPAVA